MAGEPVQGDLKVKIGKAEKDLTTFKNDFQRYGNLSRSYDKNAHVEYKEAEEEEEDT